MIRNWWTTGRMALLAAAVVLSAGLAGTLWNGYVAPGGRAIESGSLPGLRGLSLLRGNLYRYEHERRYMVIFSVRNAADRPVTVEAFPGSRSPEPPSWVGFLVREGVVMRVDYRTRARGWEPFAPFELGPGRERLLGLRMRLDNCRRNVEPKGAGLTTEGNDGMEVRYGIGFVDRTVTVRWPAYRVRAPRPAECPRSEG